MNNLMLTLFIIYCLVILILSFNLMNILVCLFIYIIMASVFIYTTCINGWLVYLIVICLLGGLMISFIYMVYLTPNLMSKEKKIFYFSVFWSIAIFININFSYLNWINERLNTESEVIDVTWFFISMCMGLFVFIFWMLYLIDWILGKMKKWARLN